MEIKEKRRKRQKKRKAESLPGKKKEKEPPVEGGAERGKVRKNERSKRNRKLMVNLVSNYKNFKGESAPAKMAILDGTSTQEQLPDVFCVIGKFVL